ncbi:MAG: DNA (cytosine-5-)-methyltransferase [Bacilli bacterium]
MTLRFLDLFAGIGGFHEAVLEHNSKSECIAAVEIDKFAAEVYEKTFNIEPLGDITDPKVIRELDDIIVKKKLDFLLAGFPCQAFSKAGNQEGFQDQTRGTLFYSIKEILKKHKPKYFLLENVRNLLGHKSKDNIKTFKIIEDTLDKLDYAFEYSILSPHRLKNKKIPQMRERIFIYGILDKKKNESNIKTIKKDIETNFVRQSEVEMKNKKEIKKYLHKTKDIIIPQERLEALEIWEELNKSIEGPLMSPIWLDVIFNKKLQTSELEWKQKLINKNLDFYEKNKIEINKWYEKHNGLKQFPASFRKLEWNAKTSIESVFDGIIQFRPSGIRIKKPDYFPTFVAINQTPIIGWERRYITPEEIKKLFGFKKIKLGESASESYKQLGNTVSVDVVKVILDNLLEQGV